jgi:hypothetical protein
MESMEFHFNGAELEIFNFTETDANNLLSHRILRNIRKI